MSLPDSSEILPKANSLAPLPSPPPPPPPPSSRVRSRPNWSFRLPNLDSIENVEEYLLGGNHPVHLGDGYGGKYKVINKLGSGGFAIVWLARNIEEHQYVALKILKADASDQEAKVFGRFGAVVRECRSIVTMHEKFTIHGPNGSHQCLVLDFCGPSLRTLQIYNQHPQISFLRHAAGKLAEGVAVLHSAGICHGGKFGLSGYQVVVVLISI